MKKMFFFWCLLAIASFSSCVYYTGFDDNDPIVTDQEYYFEVNGVKVKANDTVFAAIDELVLVKLFNSKGNSVEALFYSSNLTSSFRNGTIADIQYAAVGVYRITANITGTDKSVSVYINVSKTSAYSIRVNNVITTNGANVKTTTSQSVKFKVCDVDGKAVTTVYEFGDGNKITADSVIFYYTAAGTYKFKASAAGKTFNLNIKVTKGSAPAIKLISATISGSTINASLGFRCNAIPSFSAAKKTYVVGEIPNTPWKKYEVSETVTIGDASYFKWNVSVPVGKFRLSWIQQKDESQSFNYDLCNWAYDTSSEFLDLNDYLYVFYFKIENGNVIMSK